MYHSLLLFQILSPTTSISFFLLPPHPISHYICHSLPPRTTPCLLLYLSPSPSLQIYHYNITITILLQYLSLSPSFHHIFSLTIPNHPLHSSKSYLSLYLSCSPSFYQILSLTISITLSLPPDLIFHNIYHSLLPSSRSYLSLYLLLC